MLYHASVELRYPKGPFALSLVGLLSGASILASIVFSLLLFLSIDDNPMMQWLFGSLAVIFELGKFYAWYEFGERRAHHNYAGALVSLLFYGVLALISIGGSIGGINAATNQAAAHVHQASSKIDSFNAQIAAIDAQIALNNEAAQKYIEMERIATGVRQIQKQNSDLRKQQQALALERDSLPVASQGSIIGLIESLAAALGISSGNAQLGLVVFLSVLLDLFAAFFVSVIGEELRFRHYYHNYRPMLSPSSNNIDVDLPLRLHLDEHVVDDVEPLSLFDEVCLMLAQGDISCSKKAIAKRFNLTVDAVDGLFKDMLGRGLIHQKPNHHYQWLGTRADS
ncbi:Preprotein translocase subunit SecY [Shewanella sp. SNU WT4]|uniref:bZIP transcription factor n=1 Tax=Shewanella sp. SNU WT4 TaxID=2590015 RepID=UPI00112DB307|nr:bZIP transcription factor [Shewanella sp. SNU WT4]QDF66272.1 Preprotein translocase subunit SecY [Shewanella sp. SNU WT4]